MKRTLSNLARGLVVAGALFAVACGGGSDGGGIGGVGGGNSSADFNKTPESFVRAEYTTFFRVFAGVANAEEMMRFFEESCRSQVNTADLNAGIKAVSEELPKLKGAKIEDFDFQGKLKVTKTDKGADVFVPAPVDFRVKVDGKWQNAYEYFSGIGFLSEGDKNDDDDAQLLLVNGRYYDAECDSLTDIADDGKRANATPTPARGSNTPTPVRTTPTVVAGNRTPTPSATTRAGAVPNLSNSQVETYTKSYLTMILGVYAGTLKADDVLAFYTPECRAKVTPAKLATGLTAASGIMPKMKAAKFEDLDFQGKLKITKGTEGYDVVIPGSKDVRVKVNGATVNLHTYLQGVGLEDASDDGSETTDQSFIVRDGKLFDATCEFLEDISS